MTLNSYRTRWIRSSVPRKTLLIALLLVGILGIGASSAGSTRTQGSLTAAGATHLKWHSPPVSGPSGRNRVNVANDPADRYAVLYGGYNGSSGTFMYDTWKFQSGAWSLLSPALHPSAPTGLVLAYDPALHGVLAFGGEAPYGSSYYNETWLFSVGNWTHLLPNVSPPPRSQYAMAYDAGDHEMVLFGGYDGGSKSLSDTWTFNGTTWAHVRGHPSPPGREFASMVYDATTSQTLLVAGWNASHGDEHGTWAFSAGVWKPIAHSGFDRDRAFMSATALSNGTPVLFGGLSPTGSPGLYNDLFAFYSGSWHHLRAGHAPSPRMAAGMTYDGALHGLLLFGGLTSSSYQADTWVLK